LAVEARELLQAAGVPARVVSMPSVEWFEGPGARRAATPRARQVSRGPGKYLHWSAQNFA
ncbi:hypothetical protein, partial [Streptomyces sp. NPDC006267]|uniref:transketolase-like TK C-terminal-containing protein n=1 Tax=Streptomyces sp. NPDC006267 TaxID=3157173 RepID=UPI0033B7AB0A